MLSFIFCLNFLDKILYILYKYEPWNNFVDPWLTLNLCACSRRQANRDRFNSWCQSMFLRTEFVNQCIFNKKCTQNRQKTRWEYFKLNASPFKLIFTANVCNGVKKSSFPWGLRRWVSPYTITWIRTDIVSLSHASPRSKDNTLCHKPSHTCSGELLLDWIAEA